MSRIYVGYRRTDTAAYAGRLFENISYHFGPGFVFMDVQGGITRGQDFSQAIDTALNTCEVALVILGKHWATRVYRLHERSRHSDDAAGLGQCGSARFATLSCFAHTETETFFSVCARRPRFVPEPDKMMFSGRP